jgi:hypothetical protein
MRTVLVELPLNGGAAVAAWPAVALVGSYDLLMVIIHGGQVSADLEKSSLRRHDTAV